MFCAPHWLKPTPWPLRRKVTVNDFSLSVTQTVSLSAELMDRPYQLSKPP